MSATTLVPTCSRRSIMRTKRLSSIALGTGILLWATAAVAGPIVTSVGGSDPASIQATVDAFRASLGTLNANIAGSFGSGRREINWDGVPNAASAPNNLPANFFNVTSPRGVVFATPGTGFQVSANAVNPTSTPIEFGNIDASYPALFLTFSPQRLFASLGSNVLDVTFFVPGSATPASTRGSAPSSPTSTSPTPPVCSSLASTTRSSSPHSCCPGR